MTETAILKTAAHELTHFIQANSAQYEALKSFVVNKLTHEEGVSFEDLVADKQRREPGGKNPGLAAGMGALDSGGRAGSEGGAAGEDETALKMAEFIADNRNATPEELLSEARRFSGE